MLMNEWVDMNVMSDQTLKESNSAEARRECKLEEGEAGVDLMPKERAYGPVLIRADIAAGLLSHQSATASTAVSASLPPSPRL